MLDLVPIRTLDIFGIHCFFCAVKKAMKATNFFFSNFDLLSSKVLSYKIYKILVIRTMNGFRTHFKEGPFIFGVALTDI